MYTFAGTFGERIRVLFTEITVESLPSPLSTERLASETVVADNLKAKYVLV